MEERRKDVNFSTQDKKKKSDGLAITFILKN